MAFTTDKLTAHNQKLIESTQKNIESILAKAPSDPVKIFDPSKKDKTGKPIVSGFEPIKMIKKMIDLDEPDALWNLLEPSENVENLLVPFNLEVVVQMLNLYNELNERITALEMRLMGAISTLQTNVNNQMQQQNQQNATNNANIEAQLSAINSKLSNLEKRISDLEA